MRYVESVLDQKPDRVKTWNRIKRLKPRNPVPMMDSVDALDLLAEAFRLLRLRRPADPDFIDRLREQKLRHRRCLRNIIGVESV